jgi:FkbM family methyltransferase
MLKAMREFAADLRAFGLGGALRAVAARRPGEALTVNIRGIGPVKIRRGDSDFAVLRQVFRDHEYAVANVAIRNRLIARYQAILAAGRQPLIVDAGANIGLASLWFKGEYPAAAIAAIEPDAGNAAMLRLNTAGRAGIAVLEAGVACSAGYAEISRPRQSWGYRTERAAAGAALITMDDAYAAFPGAVPFIVKIDIEGFERDLFAANLGWLDSCFAIYIEPHDWMLPGQRSSAGFQKAMGERAFELILAGENLLYVGPDV